MGCVKPFSLAVASSLTCITAADDFVACAISSACCAQAGNGCRTPRLPLERLEWWFGEGEGSHKFLYFLGRV